MLHYKLLSECFTAFVLFLRVRVTEYVENQSGLPVHTTECLRTVFGYVCVFSTFLQDGLKRCYISLVIERMYAFISESQ